MKLAISVSAELREKALTQRIKNDLDIYLESTQTRAYMSHIPTHPKMKKISKHCEMNFHIVHENSVSLGYNEHRYGELYAV